MTGVGDESTSQEMAIVSPIEEAYEFFCPSLHVGETVRIQNGYQIDE